MLNDVVIIRVLTVERERVKFGIDALPDVIVVRQELLDETGNAPDTPKGVEE